MSGVIDFRARPNTPEWARYLARRTKSIRTEAGGMKIRRVHRRGGVARRLSEAARRCGHRARGFCGAGPVRHRSGLDADQRFRRRMRARRPRPDRRLCRRRRQQAGGGRRCGQARRVRARPPGRLFRSVSAEGRAGRRKVRCHLPGVQRPRRAGGRHPGRDTGHPDAAAEFQPARARHCGETIPGPWSSSPRTAAGRFPLK